ncbi:MAG: VOC family protein [Actinomycetota bacterium]|nr:VOC family protein [Actinomycetota bacterium]
MNRTLPPNFGIVTLGVADLERSRTFYAALGWELTGSSNPEICWFKTSGSYIGLFPYEELAADANLPAEPRAEFGGITLAINVSSEQKVTEAMRVAEEAGGRVIKEPVRAEWGGFSGYFADPDGHPWEIAYNPNFPIAEDGSLTIP